MQAYQLILSPVKTGFAALITLSKTKSYKPFAIAGVTTKSLVQELGFNARINVKPGKGGGGGCGHRAGIWHNF